MFAQILTILGLLLALMLGIWTHYVHKNSEKRKQAEGARKDLDEANKTDDPGKFIDGFGRVR
jgi:hypothetical protein